MWNWQTIEQMKKILICSKKSVRTFKLRIEPYFLSHAERGKSWRGLGLAGIQPQCRAFGATAFLAGMLHPNFCGAGEIRTRDGLPHTTFPTWRTRPAMRQLLFIFWTSKFHPLVLSHPRYHLSNHTF